ncbi:MAG: hypothetical protein NXI32_15960 [bacterium]|nr:hypothetical protein [bacterium]
MKFRVEKSVLASTQTYQSHSYSLVASTILTGMAAGMGWGIRGQYGHESGAMIAGTLASLCLVLLAVPQAPSLVAARAAAMMTVAIGIGGSMTYGQTLGLTHDPQLVGRWDALCWGMLGLFVKGGLWIGFGAAFLGMGLSGKRYGPRELALLVTALIGLWFVGVWCFNAPFDPENQRLPYIYFSDDWRFEPEQDLRPRPEIWGGYLLCWLALWSYLRLARKDILASRMAGIGILAGGLGFTGGQSIQAFHAWNPHYFDAATLGNLADYVRYFNWWNMMETTFGFIWGAGLAMGLWWNRHLIVVERVETRVPLSPSWEWTLLAIHLGLLLSAEFMSLPGAAGYVEMYIELGLLMAALPLVCIVGGRLWPYWILLPVTALPICGKTLVKKCYQEQVLDASNAWLIIIVIPLTAICLLAAWLIHMQAQGQRTRTFAASSLLATSGLYFFLNSIMFDFAWPWREWTSRTPNQIIFSICSLSLIVAALFAIFDQKPAPPESTVKDSSPT